eukprot:TRINITY_DN16608_c0_g1_i1.p1 TRINITY_DN16608_c0_g1~~TRINITY_DN16608_c0_g1_i1.p1  ORF type:complete len:1141 (+),score=282.46 TRINITY_DN16608_c0_g1_i1:53-3424(+)
MRHRVSFKNEVINSPDEIPVRRNIFNTPPREIPEGFPLSRCSESPEAKQQIETPIDKVTGDEIFSWRDSVVKKAMQESGSQRSHWDYVRWHGAQIHTDSKTLPTEGMKLRWTGNKHFGDDNFACSALSYSAGVKEAQQSEIDIHLRHIFYTNRASANLPLGNFALSLSDANKALEYRPGYVRAHIRKALALLGLQQLDDAAEAIFCCARTCTLKPDEWTYMTSILHKAIPMTECIRSTITLLRDSRLESVPQYLVSSLYHLLTLICKDDIDPMTLFMKPRDTLSDVSDCSSDTTDNIESADHMTITKEVLKAFGNGLDTPSECTSKKLSSCSDGEGMNSFRGRLLLLNKSDGVMIVSHWLSSKTASAVKIANIILQIAETFLPEPEARHMIVKEAKKSLTKKEFYQPPPPVLTDWDEGDICQVLIGKEWLRGRVVKAIRSGSYDVFINDLNNIQNVTAAELRMEVSELNEITDNKPTALSPRRGSHHHDFKDWRECEDRLGNTFYFNPKTGRSVRRLEDALIDEKPPEMSASTESNASVKSELSDLESESAEEEDNEEVINAIKSGNWVMVRHLRTGHKQYFEPQTKATTTDLALELSLRKTIPMLSIDGKFTNELTEASQPPPPPPQEPEESEQLSELGMTYPREEFPDEVTHIIPDIPINQEIRIYEEDAADAEELTALPKNNDVRNQDYEESEEELRETTDEVARRMSLSPYSKLLDRGPHPKSPVIFTWDTPADVEKLLLEKPVRKKRSPPPPPPFVEAVPATSQSGSEVELMWGHRQDTEPQRVQDQDLSRASLAELQQIARDRGIEDFGGRLMLIQRIQTGGDPNFKKPLSASQRRNQMKVQIAAQVPRELIELQGMKEAAILSGNTDQEILLESQIADFKSKVAAEKEESGSLATFSRDVTEDSHSPMSPLSMDDELNAIAQPRTDITPVKMNTTKGGELLVSPLLESLGKSPGEYHLPPVISDGASEKEETRIQEDELAKALQFEKDNPFPFPIPESLPSKDEEEVVQRDMSSTLSYSPMQSSPGKSEVSSVVNQMFGRRFDSTRNDRPPPPISGFQIGGPKGIRRVSKPISATGSDISNTIRSLEEIRQGTASVEDFIERTSNRSKSIVSSTSF